MQTILKFIVSMYTRAADVADRERGATATEYALLVALIAIIISAGVGLFGTNLNAFFNKIAGTVAGW
jgi:Flp pilus assembly protein, pilin Flp